jgi:hypothetical protein
VIILPDNANVQSGGSDWPAAIRSCLTIREYSSPILPRIPHGSSFLSSHLHSSLLVRRQPLTPARMLLSRLFISRSAFTGRPCFTPRLPARTFAASHILNMSSVTQTITLPVCDASELKNGDIKDFEFGEGEKKGKVFLAKVDDKLVSEGQAGPLHVLIVDFLSSRPVHTALITAHHSPRVFSARARASRPCDADGIPHASTSAPATSKMHPVSTRYTNSTPGRRMARFSSLQAWLMCFPSTVVRR